MGINSNRYQHNVCFHHKTVLPNKKYEIEDHKHIGKKGAMQSMGRFF